MRGSYNLIASALALFILLSAGPNSAFAAPLDLGQEHYPNIHSYFYDIHYYPNGAGTGRGLLTAYAYPEELYGWLDPDDPNLSVYLGWTSWYELKLEINPTTGEFVPNSDQDLLSVYGDPYDPDNDYGDIPLFVSSEATGFSFNPDILLFEFLFIQQSDTPVAPAGVPVGVQIWGGIIPTWSSSWSSSYGYGDTFFYPEPATVTLLSIVGLGIVLRRRRRIR